jgi:metal-responsive CopG/Arc/MetJ family transcriptional regulator
MLTILLSLVMMFTNTHKEGAMELVRINVSLPKEIVSELSKKLPPRKRSQFIAEAVKKHLKEQKARRLASEYSEAAAEIRRISRELEGTLSDGLD